MALLYRVYESYHESDKSGTMEYGIYSTVAQAKIRAEWVWASKKYPAPTGRSEFGTLYAYELMETYEIRITEYKMDVDITDYNQGYT